jgi:hypothetical protein
MWGEKAGEGRRDDEASLAAPPMAYNPVQGCQQEYLAVLSNPAIVEEFRRRVAEPDLARSRRAPRPGDETAYRRLELQLAGLAFLATLGTRRRR